MSYIEFDNAPNSFIYEDNLCVHGVMKGNSANSDLFMLNFDSMEWTKIEQEEEYLANGDNDLDRKFGGVVYQDHLVTLKQTPSSWYNALCFLNLQDQITWTTFDIQCLNNRNYSISKAITGGLMVYKNFVLSLTVNTEDPKSLSVAIMNLENFKISAPKSAEEENLSSLFMSQGKSDVTFKVENQLIPAHKQILIQKSRYFDGVFNSGMAESTQEIIEISDCEYEIFKEYLRFLYQNTITLEDEEKMMKFYVLADKYLQEDLCEKCLNFLTSKINMNNIYKILDFFAHEENIPQIRLWCLKLLKDKLNFQNVKKIVTYLVGKQEDSGFKENNKEIIKQALDFVLDNFVDINEKNENNMEIFENFLIKNIDMDTISSLANFLGFSHDLPENTSLKRAAARIRKETFEERIMRIKEAVFSFVHENVKIVMTSKIAKDFPNSFFIDFTLFSAEKTFKEIEDLKKGNGVEMRIESEEKSKGNAKKRMEPVNNDEDEEVFELKKTKKSGSAWRVME